MLESKKVSEIWGSMEWLVDASLIKDAQLSVAKMRLNPNNTSTRHKHSNCDEVIYVLNGEVLQMIDDKSILLKTGDTLFIPKNSQHQTVNNTQTEAILLISYSESERSYEACKI